MGANKCACFDSLVIFDPRRVMIFAPRSSSWSTFQRNYRWGENLRQGLSVTLMVRFQVLNIKSRLNTKPNNSRLILSSTP